MLFLSRRKLANTCIVFFLYFLKNCLLFQSYVRCSFIRMITVSIIQLPCFPILVHSLGFGCRMMYDVPLVLSETENRCFQIFSTDCFISSDSYNNYIGYNNCTSFINFTMSKIAWFFLLVLRNLNLQHITFATNEHGKSR